jgi:processive 1,2-diacylglycerol beta-glucosyltransferase
MPGFLILHATCGGGHKAAAHALGRALELEVRGREVRVEDALAGVTPKLRRLYTGSFELAVARVPQAYGAFFRLTKNADRWRVFRLARRVAGRVSCGRLRATLREARPDAVICTHFLPLEVALRERRAGRLAAPVFGVVTDYTAHGLWRQPDADLTFCSPGPARDDLVAGGVREDRIVRSGIPIAREFGEPYDVKTAKLRAGISLERPTALLLAGGGGMGPLAAVLREAGRAVGRRMDLVVVCGWNDALRAEVMEVALRLQTRVRVLGFVDPIVDLLRGADVIVTKPGGLTTSEALALGKPVVFYAGAPGQESANARFVVERGAGVDGRTPRGAAAALTWLASDATARETLGRRALGLARPNAAATIARTILARLERAPRDPATPTGAPPIRLAVVRAG